MTTKINAIIVAIVAVFAIVAAFAVPATTQATGTATPRVTTVNSVSIGGSAGTSFTLVTATGESIKLFAPIRPLADGKNTPVVGQVVSFSDQTCIPMIGCAGEAILTQKSGKATIKIAAYRKK